MRVPVDWLGEYVELAQDVTGEQIAADLVAVGLEEEGLHTSGVGGPLVVGRVLEKQPEPHKNGKTINWCQVDVGASNGTGEPQGIVCGAHNFEVGDLVAVILPGGVLPTPSGPMTISARKTYGHVSAGMICSVRELGIGDDHEGIIVLPRLLGEDRVAELGLGPGDDLVGILGLDREVVEVNVTPDRGYCFSIRGVAREYSHSTGAPFTDPADRPVDPATQDGYAVQLADQAPLDGAPGCDRYVARIVRGIDLTRQTPEWMARRLTEAGMRPIGLAVDVTNYVMLALGQPLHAFDLAALTSPIVVRRARSGERLRTLDDVDRVLDPEDLLITCGPDGSQILAIAGVMGGEDGEVTPGVTTDVLIESAHFDPRSVARTSRRHKLSSEAAKRFERGVDPDVAAAAAQMAVDLLVEHGGGAPDPAITDADERRRDRDPITLPLSMPTAYVGVDYRPERVREVLEMIGCVLEPGSENDGSGVRVTPPTWRPDLTDAPTLVEEVARIDGYDKIPSTLPRATGGRGLTHAQRSRRAVAQALAGQGLHEVLTYPFVGPGRLDELGLAVDDPRRSALRLANPLSDEAPLMRTELLQTLPDALRRNISRGSRDVALFEIDTVTLPDHAAQAPVPGVGARPEDDVLQRIRDAVPAQPLHVAIVASGHADRPGWWGPGRWTDVTDVVGWAQSAADALGVPVRRVQAERAPFHPGRCVELTLLDGTPVGLAGELHPKVLQRLGLPERSSAAELDLDVLIEASDHRTQVTSLSTHPVAASDVALVVPRSTRYAEVEESLRTGAGDLLESIHLFDVYVGDQIGSDQQSLAFRMHFRAPDRTLTTEEVNAARDAAVARAATDHGAVQR